MKNPEVEKRIESIRRGGLPAFVGYQLTDTQIVEIANILFQVLPRRILTTAQPEDDKKQQYFIVCRFNQTNSTTSVVVVDETIKENDITEKDLVFITDFASARLFSSYTMAEKIINMALRRGTLFYTIDKVYV